MVLDAEGRTDFSALQSALSAGHDRTVTYLAFDLLFERGEDCGHCHSWSARPACRRCWKAREPSSAIASSMSLISTATAREVQEKG